MLDKWIVEFDKGLRTLFAPAQSLRPHPDAELEETELEAQEKQHALGLMRVNHCGEVCAQALYQGQALTARTPQACPQPGGAGGGGASGLDRAAHTRAGRAPQSVQPAVVYRLAGDRRGGRGLGRQWNLGFLEETEQQVGAHLDSHLALLPEGDAKSRAIVTQMRDDELKHADMAHELGAATLPAPVKSAMKLSAKLMTGASYRC